MKVITMAALLACVLPLQAAPPEGPARKPGKIKPAWEWSLEERIAGRIDPAGVKERAARQSRKLAAMPDAEFSFAIAGPVEFYLDGAIEPELFLPSELFVVLIGNADEKSRVRADYAPYIAQFGWDEETFWKTIAGAITEYQRVSERALELGKILLTSTPENPREMRAEVELLNQTRCRLRTAALESLRRTWPRFDEFLYTAVARHIALGGSTPGGDEASRLRWVDGGCQ